jgi:hypothetical protein
MGCGLLWVAFMVMVMVRFGFQSRQIARGRLQDRIWSKVKQTVHSQTRTFKIPKAESMWQLSLDFALKIW